MPDDAGGVARGRHGRKRAHDGARALTTRRVSFRLRGPRRDPRRHHRARRGRDVDDGEPPVAGERDRHRARPGQQPTQLARRAVPHREVRIRCRERRRPAHLPGRRADRAPPRSRPQRRGRRGDRRLRERREHDESREFPPRETGRGRRRADLPQLRLEQAQLGDRELPGRRDPPADLARRRDPRGRRRQGGARPHDGGAHERRRYPPERAAALRLGAGPARPARRRPARRPAGRGRGEVPGRAGHQREPDRAAVAHRHPGDRHVTDPERFAQPGLRRAAQLRGERRLPDEHGERLLRRLPVRARGPGSASARPACRATRHPPCRTRPPTCSTSATAGTPGRPAPPFSTCRSRRARRGARSPGATRLSPPRGA